MKRLDTPEYKKLIADRREQTLGEREPKIPFDTIDKVQLDQLVADKLKPVDAVSTMLPSWNRVCRDEGGGIGLARGWHVIIGATTGSGKSVFALNLAAKALRAGERVAFISLEMSQTQLVTRLMAIFTGTSIQLLEHGSSFDEQVARTAVAEFTEACDRSGGLIRVNRSTIYKLDDITAAIRWECGEHGCRYVVIDYLQLAWVGSAENKLGQIEEVSHRVRQLASELKIVSIGLSQFNRQTSSNRETSPTPQGLMGGSPLENDADQVILLDHSATKRDLTETTTNVLVAKNRHGPLAKTPVSFSSKNLRVEEIAFNKEIREEVPHGG